jgi:7,8-dihydropterin-6-yl-methyl-4-(beta-D-ribofuranosyl)aminobenzene 5'-phosphate synthase
LHPGTVRTLSVLPLVDWYAGLPDLATEPGVSYLVRADGTTILFDLGLSRAQSHGPALLRNAARLGIDLTHIDCVVISHPHPDHVGGLRNALARRTMIQAECDPLLGKTVYATVPLRVTHGTSVVVEAPRVLAPGVATTGPVPAQLFLLGYTPEQALVVNVADRGVVLIVGCSHPGVEALVERARQLLPAPVYGVIGGLHFPVTGDRAGIGPLNMQRLLGSREPPWRPLTREAVYDTILYLQRLGVRLVAPSAHDTCDWSLRTFARAFPDAYRLLRVGEEVRVGAASGPNN